MALPGIVAVPAPLESSRLPGKEMADIVGKPMLQRVIERCSLATAPEAVGQPRSRRNRIRLGL